MTVQKNFPSHRDQLSSLRRIEGQIRGVQKMIEEGRYCVDILTQLHAVVGAIAGLENNILRKHLEGCVASSFAKGAQGESAAKIKEILALFDRFRRSI